MQISTSSSRPIFLSTLSLRRATCSRRSRCRPSRNFYPRSPCGERRKELLEATYSTEISIHALLAESDCYQQTAYFFLSDISIHALLAESD